jgi:hypothetical protein
VNTDGIKDNSIESVLRYPITIVLSKNDVEKIVKVEIRR